VLINEDSYEKISSSSAVDTRLAHLTKSDTLTVINTCRYLYLNIFLTLNKARTGTVTALKLDDLAASLTIRTGLDRSVHTEK
jgi:hypothetical protein